MISVLYYPEKVYSKVTLNINLQCKNHRGGKMKNLLDFYFVTGLVTSLKTRGWATGNQLTGLTENVASTLAGDVYSRGGSVSGTYAYDKNGNMINDSRRALDFGYNVLNLLSEVKTTGGELKAKYVYLADGTRSRVRDNGDVNGFDYVGSLTYRKSGAGLQLESANFGDGVIRPGDSNGGQMEVDYFLTDHLGSVRVIVDGTGKALERNDYYPFGARYARSDYPQLAVNRYKYNGKEEQVTGNLGYLDYGARMYDSGLGRWFGVDPLSENYLSQSPYHFSGNNAVINVDVNGMDYWSTSDPGQIAAFLKAFSSSGGDYFHSFEPTTWTHFTDLEFLSGLTYDDERKIFSYEYGDVINGEATRVVRRLPGYDMLLLDNTFVDIRTRHGKDYYYWWGRASGAIEQDYTIDALFIPVGKGIGTITSLFGCVGSNVYKSVGAAAARNLDKVLQTGGHTIKNSTAKALGLSKGQVKNAIEKLKKYNRMRHDSHQKIMGNGDVIDSHTGKYIDNLYDYVD